jgi:hypothetical protein
MNSKLGNQPLGNQPLHGLNFIDIDDEYNGNVDELTNKIMQQRQQIEEMYGSSDQYMIMNDKERRKMNIYKEAEMLNQLFSDKVINYVAAILDPEYNYTTGVMVKQPSLLNPPSVSIPVKTLTTVKSENQSSICISWNPTLFCTKADLPNIVLGKKNGTDQLIKANRIASVLYSLPENAGTELVVPADSWEAKVKAIPDNLPEIGVSKARLVSAKIKISFRGSILNQGGTIMGAATFQGPPGLVLNTDNTDSVYLNAPVDGREVANWADLFKVTLGDQYDETSQCPFQEKVLSNGIWAKNVNITRDANGISAIFIPTDPMDEIFYKPGTYYGEEIAKDDAIVSTKGATTALATAKGARLNYLFNIQGLSAQNNNPITIETYQTWEVLPTNLSASSLRNSSSGMNSIQVKTKVKELLTEYFKNSTGIHTNKPNQLSGLFDYLKKAAVGAWNALTS